MRGESQEKLAAAKARLEAPEQRVAVAQTHNVDALPRGFGVPFRVSPGREPGAILSRGSVLLLQLIG